jgi:DNA helicase-2/ATP-dependent DNA helicase PcrA
VADAQLNAPQRRAVEHERGAILVLAGAGSGKTRVITHRIARLIERGASPYEILSLTFTNKAAGEMRERAEALLGGSLKGLWIGTFHAICARLLRQHGHYVGLSNRFVIYDTDDQRTLIKRVMRDLGVSDRLFSPGDLLGHLDRAKNKAVGPADYQPEDFYGDVVAKVYPAYEQALLDADATDFGNLLVKTLELLRGQPELCEELSFRFRYVLVDEFQDTNHVQYQLVRLLSSQHGNLCVVGDDDQSIYGWRGADIRNILDFERDHPGALVVKLEQNYRSTQTILDAAGAVIRRNLGRKDKTLWTDAGHGDPIVLACCADERHEAGLIAATVAQLIHEEGLSLDEVAVFYRTHAQSRAIEEALRRAQLPHAVVGGIRFFDRAEVKDTLAYLRVLLNPADEVSLRRIINVPPRGIGAQTVGKIGSHAAQSGLSFHDALRACAAGTGGAAGLLGSGPTKKLAAFCALLDELNAEAEREGPAELAERVLDRSGYLERLAASDSIEAQTKSENLMEFVGGLRAYEAEAEEPSLPEFLEQVALASEVDDVDDERGTITLMTVHSAKGLEFPVVFLVGLEHGIFPHSRSLEDVEKLEEERRLAYVAITRARKRLFLTFAQRRFIFGQTQTNPPSLFLREIPESLVQRVQSGAAPRTTGPHRPAGRDHGGARQSGQRQRQRRDDYDFYDDEPPVRGKRGQDDDDFEIDFDPFEDDEPVYRLDEDVEQTETTSAPAPPAGLVAAGPAPAAPGGLVAAGPAPAAIDTEQAEPEPEPTPEPEPLSPQTQLELGDFARFAALGAKTAERPQPKPLPKTRSPKRRQPGAVPPKRRSATRPGAAPRSPQQPSGRGDEVWVDYSFDQSGEHGSAGAGGKRRRAEPGSVAAASADQAFRIGQQVHHAKYGVGTVQAMTGRVGQQNLVIRFSSGPRTIRADFVEPA